MNVTLYLSGDRALFVPDDPADRPRLKDVFEPLSFEVEGAQFSEHFQSGRWDGRRRMASIIGRGVRLPAGLAPRGYALLKAQGIRPKMVDQRLEEAPVTALGAWDHYDPRDYQAKAAAKALKAKRGVLSMSIRSGKTLTAAWITRSSWLRTLFLAPSNMLVDQTAEVFAAALPKANVTTFGAGGADDLSGDVVVGTVQSLSSKEGTKVFERIRRSFPLVFIDEVHHLVGQGKVWRRVVEKLYAPRKIGLSGTLDEYDMATKLTVEGICGPVLHRVTMNEMFDRGFLVSPIVTFLPYEAERASGKWSPRRYGELIVRCEARNHAIVAAAKQSATTGKSVLIDTSRVGHARELGRLLRRSGMRNVRVVTGTSKDKERQAAIDSLSGSGIVIGTLLGEGIDIPDLKVVINAEGGARSASAIQRLRNLTPTPGKSAWVYELDDRHHPVLERHTAERRKMYESLRGERKGPTLVAP